MGERYVEFAEVPEHIVQEDGVGVLVAGTRERARAAVHHQRNSGLLAEFVSRIEAPVVRGDSRVYGVQFAGDRAQVDLALQFFLDRIVQMRVDVGDQLDAPGVVPGQREHVLDGLYAGDTRAVLAEQQRDVDALFVEMGVEGGGVGRAVRVVDPPEDVLPAEVVGPLLPSRLEAGQAGRVEVYVDQRHSVEHRTSLGNRAGNGRICLRGHHEGIASGSGCASTPVARALSSTLRILPVAVVGSASTNRTRLGRLKDGSSRRQ
jgi:hypothetical protein